MQGKTKAQVLGSAPLRQSPEGAASTVRRQLPLPASRSCFSTMARKTAT
jgi:hypothetical protein